VRDPLVTAYVGRIGARLATRARGPRYPYVFYVANRRELNAFALPGGPIIVNRGTLEAVRSEAQLAAVLAHEIAHVGERHAAAQLTTLAMAQWSLGLLGALLGNTGGALTTGIVARAAVNGALLSFSREDERAADAEGTALLARAGWDPRAMIEVMDLLEKRAQQQPAVATFFSTHPPPADRAARLSSAVRRLGRGTRNSAEFRAVQARLSRLPPRARSRATPHP
jgi:predicted Zn-dependent protease